MAEQCNNKKISFKTLIATGSLALAVAVIVAGIMGSIYCSKAELATVNLKAERAEWQVKSMATRVQNIERRLIAMSTNVTKLLERLRVRPADPPYLTPIPVRPHSLDREIGSSP